MTRTNYTDIQAINASRIKAYYTESTPPSQYVLDEGAEFHRQLLETKPSQMRPDALNAYKAIMAHPVLSQLFKGSHKEMIVTGSVEVDGVRYRAKGIVDMLHPDRVLADIKTTAAKNLREFAEDMAKHYNHVQAWWYCKMLGIDFDNFYFIGIPAAAKKRGAKPTDLFIYKFPPSMMLEAERLVAQYLKDNGDTRAFVVDTAD